MIETEILEPIIEEDELLPEEVAALRDEMWAKISEALDLGVFTDKEAADWEAGFMACDRLEYMQNLIDIIDDFIASGLEVLEQLEAVLDTELLTPGEKTDAEWRAEILSYQDKRELIGELRTIVKEVARYKQQLVKILRSAHLPPAKSQEFLQNFAEATADKKEGVVTRVAMTAVELNARFPIIQSRIIELLNGSQFGEARAYLSNSHLESVEYEQLTHKIDLAEAQYFRTLACSL